MTRQMGIQPIDGFKFDFTRRWFLNRNRNTFVSHVLPKWEGKPITYLELGVFEGMSMVWMLQYVLTHPDSRGVGVDPWLMTRKLDNNAMEAVMKRAYHNTSSWRWDPADREQCQLIRGNSVEVLRRMRGKGGYADIKNNSVDLCMIDGDHNSLGALDDARNCFHLVKKGGWILFDDVENDHKKTDHVKTAIDMFLEEKGKEITRLWKHKYMECYVKN